MAYLIDDLRTLMGQVNHHDPHGDRTLRYVCALLAELAYYEVPQFEIDDRRRAKLVPSSAFQRIAAAGRATSALGAIAAGDFEQPFVALTDAMVAVGIALDDTLYVAMRGTKLLFDWGVNLRAELIPRHRDFPGRCHQGFLLEASRIARRIDLILANRPRPPKHCYVTGHSLGGAVAALTEPVSLRLPRESRSILFAAPRSADVQAFIGPIARDPIQIRREADIVPSVPPESHGYADYPDQYHTDGTPFLFTSPAEAAGSGARRLFRFAASKAAPHEMSLYRKEVGASAGIPAADTPFVDFARIDAATIKGNSRVVGP